MANSKTSNLKSTSSSDVAPAPRSGVAEDIASTSTSQVDLNTTSDVLDLRKKELIDQVVERTGVKKRDAKPVIEAMLAVLGEAVSEERSANLEPLGKLRVTRSKDTPNGRLHVCRLRRKKANPEKRIEEAKTAPTPLAERDR